MLFINALVEIITYMFWLVVIFGGMFVAVCLLLLAAIAVEYYIKKWRSKK